MRLFLALAVTAVLTAACGGGSGAEGGDAAPAGGASGGSSVTVSDFEFDPETATTAVGEEVTWTLAEDSSAHTVKFDDEESEELAAGDTYSRSFSEAGEFPYVCGIHPQMTGTVTVE